MGKNDSKNTSHTTASERESGFDPAQMPAARYTLYRYGGMVYNRQYQASLNYIFRLDTLNSKLDFKADYLHHNAAKSDDYDTRNYLRPEDTRELSSELRHEQYKLLSHLLAVRLDLTKNFSEERTFRAGLNYDLQYADNDNRVHNYQNDAWVFDPNASLLFVDRTQSGAAYTEWADTYKKFSYMAGLRL